MRQRGQTTTYQTRLEINEYAEARVERPTNRHGSWVLSLDRTEVATTISAAGTCRLHRTHGSSCHRSCQYLSYCITRGYPSPARAPSGLGTNHTWSNAQDGCLLERSAAPESSMHSQAPQTSGLDAPLSTTS